MESVGCSKEYLNNWVQYNIKLDNLIKYEVDHVNPLSLFDIKNFQDVIDSKCNHWTNLMPVTPKFNSDKNNTPPTKHELFKQELRIYLFKKM